MKRQWNWLRWRKLWGFATLPSRFLCGFQKRSSWLLYVQSGKRSAAFLGNAVFLFAAARLVWNCHLDVTGNE
jgi:hypothetical protein